MQLHVENLGVIKSGDIDLDKNLIILAGPNNSGKSYLAYLVHGIESLFSLSGILKPFSQEAVFFKRIQDMVTSPPILTNSELVKTEIIRSELTNNFESILKLLNFQIENAASLIFASNAIKPKVTVATSANSKKISGLNYFEDTNIEFRHEILSHFVRVNFEEILGFQSVFFYPAERTALNMLGKEVYKEKTMQSEIIGQKILAGGDLNDIKATLLPRYSLAIRDYLFFVNDLDKLSQNTRQFSAFAEEIEQMLLKGKVSVNEYGDIKYTPTGSHSELDMHVSSSLVKSLSGLVLYFRHLAQVGDFIIIDEPEINLHPDNQRIFARIIVKAVNLGFRVMLSTHSDYITRELNNLIMLGSQSNDKTKDLTERYAYANDELLQAEQVGVYIFDKGTICEEKVTEKGFAIREIDKIIMEQNIASDDIYNSLIEMQDEAD